MKTHHTLRLRMSILDHLENIENDSQGDFSIYLKQSKNSNKNISHPPPTLCCILFKKSIGKIEITYANFPYWLVKM